MKYIIWNITLETYDEIRVVRGSLFPSDTMDIESRIGKKGALQIQIDDFQKTIDKTIEEHNKTDDEDKYQELDERSKEAGDKIIEQYEKEEVRYQQEQGISRLEKFKQWLKENIVAVAGIITSIIVGARKAIVQGWQSVSKFGKALWNLAKKIGPLIAPFINLLSQAVSLSAKGITWLASIYGSWQLLLLGLFMISINSRWNKR